MSWSFSFSSRFNSSFLFVASVPSYQLFCLARLALPFLSPCPFRCVHPFVLTLPSYLLFLSFRFNSHLTFHRKLQKMQFARNAFFFQVFKGGAIRAGICRPSSHMRPLAATRVAASGCKWLQIMQMAASDAALEISNPTSRATGHVRPRAATCGHLP